jgi:PAS domain S-box-containing protein
MGNLEQSSENYYQSESQSFKRKYNSISNFFQATEDLFWIQGRYSPRRILAITIGGIVLAEVIAMMVVYFVRDWLYVQQVILDASIMAVIIFPILYFLSFRPLLLHIHQRSQAEKELRQSEVKFRTFVDWTYDWEEWLDPQGKIVYTSPSCERITGYTPEELFRNPDLLTSIVHPDDRQFYKEHQAIIHDAKAAPTTVEYRIVSRDGSEHWIEHICRPVYGRDERYLGRRVSNRDITERKQAEKKIIEQNKKEIILTETIQSIQTDIARDLHDTLGQNISFLRMNLEHLSDAEFNNQTYMQTQIRHMTQTADESYELIRTMLANLQSGYSADPVSLFTRYAEQIAERSLFQIDITSDRKSYQLPPNHVRQLFYIFREALNNIEKYANASLVNGEFLWEDNALTLVITDNGSGFDLDALQSTNHYGLKFMRERAEIIKGSFFVQSTPGQGTTIRVVVPYPY